MSEFSQSELHDLVAPLAQSARDAGKAIMEVYATDFAARLKTDSSPVTEADERADAIIVAALHRLTPDITVISEETATAATLQIAAPTRFWLVDPLDGTREFVNRNGEFTVNIALIESYRPVFGVVYVPVTGMMYYGHGRGTAMQQKDGKEPHSISVRPAPVRGAVVLHSRSHADEEQIAAYIADLPDATRRVSGSSVKFCLVATGDADFYPRFGPTMEWDTGAAHAVLEAAGGHVLNLDGTPLRYGKKEFRNPHFIARGSGPGDNTD